jgi:hypothetical protein
MHGRRRAARDIFSAAMAPKHADRDTPESPYALDRISDRLGESGGRVRNPERSLPIGTSLVGGRFVIRSFLGKGGMGQVYEADDTVLKEIVAVKTLHRVDPKGITDLKREFRSLVNVAHPNLVTLYELFADDDACFFAMAFVRGVDFVQHVRSATATQGTREESLYHVLRQLAAGVSAIHAAGKLHRDLKPSNVLVTEEGRVVILDFGLVTDHEALAGNEASFELVGTPQYMAPEQARGQRASPASDWYAVGAMLFEALTGQLPFQGHAMLLEKQLRDAPPPSTLVPSIPSELDRLCGDLLRCLPMARPSESEILDRLGAPSPVRPIGRSATSAPSSKTPFVGRTAELDALRAALEATKDRPVTAFVRGLSGMGKTALVERFLRDVRAAGEAIVLSGRCYERESVRYNAFDSIVDALCEHFRGHPEDAGAPPLAPGDFEALAQAFPACSDLRDVLRDVPPPAPLPPEPQEVRRRAFGALKALLRGLASRGRLVVHVDDLQWADVDSARLMQALLSQPDRPCLLFVGTYRSDEIDKSPFLRELSGAGHPQDDETRTIDVGPLGAAEEVELIAALNPGGQVDPESLRKEAQGSPYFIAELLRYLSDQESANDPSRALGVTLDQALVDRISRLGDGARDALSAIAVATTPIAQALLSRALASRGELQGVLTTLRAANLVRAVGAVADLSVVTTYHDRIRETVCRTLPTDALRGWHLALADAIEESEDANPESVVGHLMEAGEVGRAGTTAVEAARRAAATLAFERATKLYAVAIDHGNYREGELRALRVARAEALVNGGRCADAAAEYFSAADGAPLRQAATLRRRAAAQLLRSGHVDRGISILVEGLAEHGIDLPEDAIAHFVPLGERFRKRGLAFEERPAAAIAEADLARIDVCWDAAIGLATINASRAGYLTVHSLMYALDAGDPFRILRGLAMYVLHVAAIAPRSRTIRAVVDLARALAGRVDTPDAHAWWAFAQACADFFAGNAPRAAASFAEAETIWRSSCVGVSREIAQARYLLVLSLHMTGSVRELRSLIPSWIAEADGRDDLYLGTVLRSGSWPVWLGANDPDRAESEVERVAEDLPRVADHAEWMVAVSRGHIDLYRGDAERAWTRLAERWEGILSSTIAMLTIGRAMALELHGRLALARAVTGQHVQESLAVAASDARELEGIALPCFEPRVALISAGIATLSEGPDAMTTATRLLEQAEGDFMGEAGNLVGAACARRRRGQLLGPKGAHLVGEADGALRGAGIADPARWTELFAPGRY